MQLLSVQWFKHINNDSRRCVQIQPVNDFLGKLCLDFMPFEKIIAQISGKILDSAYESYLSLPTT
jgi:hypothetical protein